MNVTPSWKRIIGTSIPNLWVLYSNNTPVGMIDKPSDTKPDKNAWRIYRGIGDKAEFIGHRWKKIDAVQFLEKLLVTGFGS